MTNLIHSERRQRWTRGRVLVGLPIVAGILLSAPVVALLLRPLWQDVHDLQQRREVLLDLQRNLPSLERKLEAEKDSLVQAERQQALLLGLLAGRDKVQTFLALLNQQARLSGVTIQRYEPLKTTSPASASTKKSKKAEDDATPQDPLLSLGYQKSSVAFAVNGPFVGLQQFLQRVEALELLVESSDLEIKAATKQEKDEEGAGPPVESKTQLTMQLSFYDPQPNGAVDSDNSKEKLPK